MRKDASSQQLFVRFDEGEQLLPLPAESTAPTTDQVTRSDLGRQLHMVGTTKHNLRGCAMKASAIGAAALVYCALMVFAGLHFGFLHIGGQASTEQLPAAQRKDMVIGSPTVPEELPNPPQSPPMRTGHPAYHCSYEMADECPAFHLFFNPEVFEVATENIMQVGRGLMLHSDREVVKSTIKAGFRNISTKLKQRAPNVVYQLSLVKITEDEKDAVLTWMRLMSTAEVQSVGYEVALAMRRSTSLEKDVVKSSIESMLRSNRAEIQQLRDQLISESVLKFWGTATPFRLSLADENIQMIEAVHGGKFFGSLNASFYADFKPGSMKLPRQEKAYGAWGGVLEEARVLLDTIRLVALVKGKDVSVPQWATSLRENVDVEDLGSELLSCELHEEDGMNNFMKALLCPLKYGAQGMDALRAVGSLGESPPEPAI